METKLYFRGGECDCKLEHDGEYYVLQCPLHAAASDMLTALRDMYFQFAHNGDESDSDHQVLDTARAVILLVTGGGK